MSQDKSLYKNAIGVRLITKGKTILKTEPLYDPRQQYQRRFDQYSSDALKVDKSIQVISNLRLLIFMAFIFCAVMIYRTADYYLLGLELVIGTAVFAGVVLWHNYLHRKNDILKKKIEINSAGLKRMDGQWHKFKDTGEEFIDHGHPYSWDFDLFGPNSLFQWICTCHTFYGRKLLAEKLCEAANSVGQIRRRQEAIKELAGSVDWRQELELHGVLSDTGSDPHKFLDWSCRYEPTFKSGFVVAIFRALPWISFSIGSAGYLFSGTMVCFAVVYTLQLLLYVLLHAKAIRAIESFQKNGPMLLAFSRLLRTIENKDFNSEYLKDLKLKFGSEGKPASGVFYSLSKILNAAEVRNSPMAHLFANAIMLWDFQCIIRADKLKKNYGRFFGVWIETIGRFEALSSLSVIAFENPQWAFPYVLQDELLLKGEGLGHPLLHHKARITNDFPVHRGGSVAIITGSNMSGKSTFLRTVGINLVLAFAGAPVCASSLCCSPVKIYTSMRVNDDLSARVSTFYAELLRIKKMVEAVRRGENVVFFLDELFRGTNSQDRHDGAVAVLNALSNNKSIGIISTHDLQLCELSRIDDKKFVNYHFREQYKDGSITFDYKLNSGESKTKNAMFLIKMIGISE